MTRDAGNQGGLLAYAEALGVVRSDARRVRPAGSEEVPLWEAHGRVLAEGIAADRDQPPFDRSTRDGFAVSLAPGGRDSASRKELRWSVLGTVHAGEAWTGAALQAGEAIEIMTGAPVPAGADAVVMVEHVIESDGADREGRSVALAEGRSIALTSNVVGRGTEARAGEKGLVAGTVLGPAEIAWAASVGAAAVRVTTRPRVAILSTGDELVELGDPAVPVLATQQIRNSNSYALAALVSEAGGRPWRLPIARDTRESLHAAVEQARTGADLLLLTGGVSAGRRDLVEEVLLGLGASFRFTGVRMQPGKPVVFGAVPTTNRQENSGSGDALREDGSHGSSPVTIPVFGLPGNPVSTEVTFRALVAPLLRSLCGEADPLPRFGAGRLDEEITTDGALTRFLPARLDALDTSGMPASGVRLVPWRGSGDLASNARANCYAVLAPGREVFPAGEWVPVLLR